MRQPNRWVLRARAAGTARTVQFRLNGTLAECLNAVTTARNPITGEAGFLRHATVSIRPEGIE